MRKKINLIFFPKEWRYFFKINPLQIQSRSNLSEPIIKMVEASHIKNFSSVFFRQRSRAISIIIHKFEVGNKSDFANNPQMRNQKLEKIQDNATKSRNLFN